MAEHPAEAHLTVRDSTIREVAAVFCKACAAGDAITYRGHTGWWHSRAMSWCDAKVIRDKFPEAFPDQRGLARHG